MWFHHVPGEDCDYTWTTILVLGRMGGHFAFVLACYAYIG